MNAEQGFKLHPGAASDITSIWEFIIVPKTILLPPSVSVRTF